MSRKPYEYEVSIINIYIKIYYIFMSISFKFNYIPYKINKIIILIYFTIEIL